MKGMLWLVISRHPSSAPWLSYTSDGNAYKIFIVNFDTSFGTSKPAAMSKGGLVAVYQISDYTYAAFR